MLTKSAAFYDAIYDFKDYHAEAQKVHTLIQQHNISGGNTLLNVGCGTGAHDVYLREHYSITGLDLDAGMLAIARERLPELRFVEGDMRDFELGEQFDAVISLFSAIGYVVTVDAMRRTIQNLARHTKSGGVVIVEPWFAPGQMTDHYFTSSTIKTPEFHITRMAYTELHERVSYLNFHYLIDSAQGIEHFIEVLEMGLFTLEEQRAAFEDAGLRFLHDEEGITGRGLLIGIKP